MKILVGLGNPGENCAGTRHNLGFMIIDEILKTYSASPQFNKKFESIIYSLAKDKILVKPQTFMNLSGRSIRAILDFYKAKVGDLMVVHDDVDLEFGEIKHHFGRGSAGHNGVQSIIDNLKTNEFSRLRLGVGKPTEPIATENWVLQKFTQSEDDVEQLVKRASEVAVNWLKET